ncbi:MAG TPA: nitric-oxide reductase large subunit, partial [Candidatus Omnitrophota bacterium]|nr:nitric-oxide reductase large subunit [Candidatus Omnitrophota bacterium]
HTAFMGVYGMLAIGIALFCLRYLMPADRWSDRAAKFSFWSLNIGLAWMSFATLFPLGVLQLYHSVKAGYVEARSLEFLTSGMNVWIEWVRLPGDLLFIAGTVPILWLAWNAVRGARRIPESIGEAAPLFMDAATRTDRAGAES